MKIYLLLEVINQVTDEHDQNWSALLLWNEEDKPIKSFYFPYFFFFSFFLSPFSNQMESEKLNFQKLKVPRKQCICRLLKYTSWAQKVFCSCSLCRWGTGHAIILVNKLATAGFRCLLLLFHILRTFFSIKSWCNMRLLWDFWCVIDRGRLHHIWYWRRGFIWDGWRDLQLLVFHLSLFLKHHLKVLCLLFNLQLQISLNLHEKNNYKSRYLDHMTQLGWALHLFFGHCLLTYLKWSQLKSSHMKTRLLNPTFWLNLLGF